MKKFTGFRKNKEEKLDTYEEEFMASSKKYIAKVKGERAIGFLLKSMVITMGFSIMASFAGCQFFSILQKVSEANPTRTEQTKTGDEENQNGGNNNIVVNPGNENGNSGENNQNGNNNENNNENGGENNNIGGENSGENGGDQEDPNNNTGENGENQGENGGENGNGGDNGNENPENPNPDDPTPDDPTPDDPTPDDPQPEELDFSGLEAKLVEVILAKHRGVVSEEIIAFSVESNKLKVLYDLEFDAGEEVRLAEVEISSDVSTKENIETTIGEITVKKFTNSKLIQKATSEITIDGVRYSKEGIEGDNPFARQCGVENAWMTYVSDPGTQTFANTETGYGKIVKFLILGNSNSATLKEIVVESFSGISNDQVYQNFLQSRAYENSSQQYTLGDNLKKTKIAEASDLEWSYSIN